MVHLDTSFAYHHDKSYDFDNHTDKSKRSSLICDALSSYIIFWSMGVCVPCHDLGIVDGKKPAHISGEKDIIRAYNYKDNSCNGDRFGGFNDATVRWVVLADSTSPPSPSSSLELGLSIDLMTCRSCGNRFSARSPRVKEKTAPVNLEGSSIDKRGSGSRSFSGKKKKRGSNERK